MHEFNKKNGGANPESMGNTRGCVSAKDCCQLNLGGGRS